MHKPNRFVLWGFYRTITIVRGFPCAIKTNVLPHSLITGTLKTPNKAEHSVLKLIEESLELEHPALENVLTNRLNICNLYNFLLL